MVCLKTENFHKKQQLKNKMQRMEMQDFTITKRDGSKDRFSLDKIMNAIIKAFDSVGAAADLGTVSKIISHIDIHEGI